MKNSPHILISEFGLTEGHTHTALCGRELRYAGWVKTDGDFRNSQDWMLALQQSCKKCRLKFGNAGYQTGEVKVYFALDGELLLPARERMEE
jgi:hypothetical protein